METWKVYSKRADFDGIAKKYHIDPVTARIIRNRDIIEDEQIRRFLEGGVDDLYDPHLMKDVDLLCDILVRKIDEKASIRVIGDYDIDGVMSSYILITALERVGARVSAAIPHRMTDGYGLNSNIIENAKSDGVDTIITCDNGIAAIKEIELAHSYGMTVLVTDHHEVVYEELNGQKKYISCGADAIVNPHQVECNYPYENLCGAGVAWKVVCAIYERYRIPYEEALGFLEFVAFATVGDIVSLTDENRILVKEGLKRIHKTSNPGMQALIARCGIERDLVGTYHFGYVLGPCINASGRLDTAQRSLELFLAKNPANAAVIASELVALNEERKDLTQKGVEEAILQCEEKGYDQDKVIVLFLQDAHESIAGIIAGRIRERYHRPTIVLTRGEEMIKGSGRSVEAYSMFEELTKVKDLLVKFGGHPMAAGVSLQEDNIEEFRRRLNEACELTEEDFIPVIHIDVPMPLDYVRMDLIEQFQCLAPFGRDNEKPVFADRGIRIRRMWIIGKKSNVLRLELISSGGCPMSGIFFGDITRFTEYLSEQFGSDQVEAALHGRMSNLEISAIYAPTINRFRDEESIQIEIMNYK